MRGVGGGGRN